MGKADINNAWTQEMYRRGPGFSQIIAKAGQQAGGVVAAEAAVK